MDWNSLKQSLSPTTRFNRDVLWNIGSLGVLGVAGIALNFVIGRYAGAAALGVFNQVYAIYIVLSQLAVGGVHTSVLKGVSHHQQDPTRCAHIMSSALLLGALLSGSVCVLAYLARGFAGRLLQSPDVVTGLTYALPGLLLFSLDKILLNVLNGARHMRAFAVFNALRFVFILGAILAILGIGAAPVYLPLSFTIAEAMMFVGLSGYVAARLFLPRLPRSLRADLAEHLSFGARGVLSGIISDLNTRVDVLMLGYFLTDAKVGIYTMAATLAEGFLMLPIVIQRNVNPILGRCFAEGDAAKIESMSRRIRRLLHPAMAAIGLAAALAYPLLMNLFFPGQGFREGWPAFCILAAGVVILSGYAPMGGILFQGGRPGMQTLRMALVILGNAALNATMIPLFEWYCGAGVSGAATATAIAYVLQAVLLLIFSRRLFGVILWR